MTKKAITDPNDPGYDPAKDPNFMDQTVAPSEQPSGGVKGDPSEGAIPSLDPDRPAPGAPLMNAEYNQDVSLKNPLLADERENGREKDVDLDGTKLAPPGMPPVNPADGPFAEDVVPTGWSRYPTAEEVAWYNETYPLQKGAPYQPGGHGVEEDKVREDRRIDGRFNADGSAKETDKSENTDPYSK